MAGTAQLQFTGMNASPLLMEIGTTGVTIKNKLQLIDNCLGIGTLLGNGAWIAFYEIGDDDFIGFGTLKSGISAGERMRLTSFGSLLLGHTVETDATSGDFVLANTKTLRSVNGVGDSTFPLVSLNSSNELFIGQNSNIRIRIGNDYFHIPALATALAAASGNSGCLYVDTTNSRLVYHSGASRFHLTGTSF
jgi:hypothetical protein